MRSERQKEVRRKYEQSEKGKTAKRRHEAAYVASGGRAKAEARRATRPLSEARLKARQAYAHLKRSADTVVSELDRFVLSEAISLMRLRKKMLGTEWHVDHITPVSKGGLSTHDNLQVVPGLWNRKKSNKHTERFFACA